MDKNSVKALKAAWQKYQRSESLKDRDAFLRQMELHHFSVFSCLELHSR